MDDQPTTTGPAGDLVRELGAAFRGLAKGLGGAAANIPATTTGARTYWDAFRLELTAAAAAAGRVAELFDPVHVPGTVHGIRPHQRRIDPDLARHYLGEFGISAAVLDDLRGGGAGQPVRGHAADCAAHTGAACDHGCSGGPTG